MQALPPIDDSVALFLDFDGTLAEIAPRPDAVRLAPGLVPLLDALHERLGGALAVVSGRPLADLDAFLAPLRLPAAAEHGALLRLRAGATPTRAAAGRGTAAELSPALDRVEHRARELAARHPGLLVERKTATVALHYRGAPELGERCVDTMRAALGESALLELLHGKCVVELRPSGTCKGAAIDALMRQPPFAGRLPLFAGDDVTDEAGFAKVRELGGISIKVGPGETIATHRCESPLALRDWLRGIVEGGPARRRA